MKNKKLLIGVLSVALLSAAGTAYYSRFGQHPAQAAEDGISPESAAIVKLDPFLTNIADERRARVEVALAVAPISRSEEVQADPLLIARLRDKILMMLASRTYEQLSDPRGKEDFRQNVRIAAQQMIVDGEVQEALFVDFVIQ